MNKIIKIPENVNASLSLIGMLLAFVLFFIQPVFLNAEAKMQFFVYVPAWDYLGVDLEHMRTYVSSWLVNGQTPYIDLNLYPPFTMAVFSPILFTDLDTAYAIVTTLSLFAYGIVALLIPRLILGNTRDSSIILLFFLTGLVSYGLHFELERGQFNLIAFAFSMLAIYVYHKKKQYQFWAYVFLTISVQLKVYPAIFLLMLVDDWSDWKRNLRNLFLFIFANISLLFILGYPFFLDFIDAISKQIINPSSTVINHSIRSFSDILFRKIGYGNLLLEWGMKSSDIKQLINYSWLVQIVLFIYLVICLILIVLREVTLRRKGISVHLLFTCTLVALLAPSVSLDYKLPLLVGPAALFMSIQPDSSQTLQGLSKSLVMNLFGSFIYAITLFSYEYKPTILINNLPILMILLTLVTIDAWYGDYYKIQPEKIS